MQIANKISILYRVLRRAAKFAPAACPLAADPEWSALTLTIPAANDAETDVHWLQIARAL